MPVITSPLPSVQRPLVAHTSLGIADPQLVLPAGEDAGSILTGTVVPAVATWAAVSPYALETPATNNSLVLNEAKRAIAAGEIDLNADDIRVLLVMVNTTADTENTGITTLSDYTTLDECDSTGYARQALTTEAVNKDDPNTRAEFDADDASFSGMSGDASRGILGLVVYKHVTNDTDSIPIAYIEATNKPLSATETDISVPWDAEGIIQFT